MPPVISLSAVRSFVIRVMTKAGACEDHASWLAELLAAADERGHFSHGLNRLEMYATDVQTGMTAGHGEPIVEKSSGGTALVDGQNLLGPVVGQFCIDLAIKKAQTSGISIVTTRRSNHYGIAGWYAMRAADQGLIGMSFTNTSPVVFPTRAAQPALGTNPIAFAAPVSNEPHFVLDMATSAVAIGKVEVQQRKQGSIPAGWGVDSSGKGTTDPDDVLERHGGMQPLGGSEVTSGYKGYGLAAMVDVLCGVLSGSGHSTGIRSWLNPENNTEADLGQCFIVLDPSCFAPGFPQRMSGFTGNLRGLTPVDPANPVLVPGEPELQHAAKVAQLGGVPYHDRQLSHMVELATRFGVAPPEVQSAEQ